MKKYTATINVIDNDYRSWVGDESIQVNSWEEAQAYCDKEDWSGHSHMVEHLRDNKTRKAYRSRKELECS